VFHNLLDNAIKYTPEEGHIKATLERVRSEAVVAIEDWGIGIPPEHLSHVFDRFYRVVKSSDAGEGAGLGLSIVQSIVMSLGGCVEVSSKVGEGSVFRVFLPLSARSHGVQDDNGRNDCARAGTAKPTD
jgi:signal transduction histidine kinase